MNKYLNKMISLPINVINLICEWAAQEDIDWYPFFSPKNHRLSWKVNKYSKKFMKRADIIMRNKFTNPVIHGTIRLYNITTLDMYTTNYKAIFLQYCEGRIPTCELYIEFDSDNNIYSNYIMRAMVVVFNTDINKNEMLYVNGTPYANINFGWAHLKIWPKIWSVRERITIGYETY